MCLMPKKPFNSLKVLHIIVNASQIIYGIILYGIIGVFFSILTPSLSLYGKEQLLLCKKFHNHFFKGDIRSIRK